MAIDCVSPNPLLGEWHPAQVLSLCRPVILSNQSSRPRSARSGSILRPRRRSSVELDAAGEARFLKNLGQVCVQVIIRLNLDRNAVAPDGCQ